jgi:hypothetical protein
MKKMMPRLALVASCAVGLAGFVAAPAQAATTITVNKTTQITTTSALVSATINTGGLPATYTFEFGTTTQYLDGASPIAFIPKGAGATTVTAVLDGLTPGTKYHFDVAVANNSGGAYYTVSPSFSKDNTFKTKKVGSLALTAKDIKVKGRKASVTLKCTGDGAVEDDTGNLTTTKTCDGKLGITLHHKGTLVTCTTGKFSIRAGHRSTLKLRMSRGCLTLLAAQKSLNLGALASATLTTGQKSFHNQKVRLKLV